MGDGEFKPGVAAIIIIAIGILVNSKNYRLIII